MRAALASLLATLCVGCGEGRAADSHGELRLEIDAARVRNLGWVASDASDLEAYDAVQDQLERRLDALELGLAVTLDPANARLSVGPTDRLATSTRTTIDRYIAGVGQFELLLEATAEDLRGVKDLATERARLDTWRAAHPDVPVVRFNALSPAEGGPHPRLYWAPVRGFDAEEEPPGDGRGDVFPLMLPDRPESSFGARSVEGLHSWWTSSGAATAVRLEVQERRALDLERFVAAAAGRRFAMLLGAEVVVASRSEQQWWGSSFVLVPETLVDVRVLSNGIEEGAGPLRAD